jgi:DNA-3-methyladenine glycosylase
VSRTLTRAWFARAAPLVAPELLGRVLVRRLPDGAELRARIVEVEAYEPNDPASHSFRGPTARNASMFGAAGHLYVYLVYGLHHCLNVVTGPPGYGSAVLLRAAQPLAGSESMAANRGTVRADRLCSGPARLAQALGVERSFDGLDLLRSDRLRLDAGRRVPMDRIAVTRRIGVSTGVDTPWRFVEAGSRWASPSPRA